MTLMDAQQYDEARARRRRKLIIIGIVAAIVLAWVAYHMRNYPQRHAVAQFFADLQKQDYEAAYGAWFRDPEWKQHPNEYSNYGYNDFYRDWGPGGEWGLIKTYKVDCSLTSGSGVIVQTTVNNRAEHSYLWVASDKTLSFSPSEIQCGNWFAWLLE